MKRLRALAAELFRAARLRIEVILSRAARDKLAGSRALNSFGVCLVCFHLFLLDLAQ